MLWLGVEGKAAGRRTLRVLAEADKRLDPGGLEELISRARRQADLLEELRVRAADQIIGLVRARWLMTSVAAARRAYVRNV